MGAAVEICLIIFAFLATMFACFGDSSKPDAKGRNRLTSIGRLAIAVAIAAMLGNILKWFEDQRDKERLEKQIAAISSELVSSKHRLSEANSSLTAVRKEAEGSRKSLQKVERILNLSSSQLDMLRRQNEMIISRLKEALKSQDPEKLRKTAEELVRHRRSP